MLNLLEKVVEPVEVDGAPLVAEIEAELKVEYKKAQDMNSYAFHVQGKDSKALCGATTVFYGRKPITVEGVLLSVPRQNGGWFWCEKCASLFTGESEQMFIEGRTNRAALHH